LTFRLVTDCGTTPRGPMTRTRALKIWEAHHGICVLCHQKIDGVRDAWFIEHIRALELGGSHTEGNLGPAHYSCKAGKDAKDHSAAAKAKSVKARHLGIRIPRHVLPGSRASKWKKTMSGKVVPR